MITGNDVLKAIGSGYTLQNHHLLDRTISQFCVDSRSVTKTGALFAAITLEEDAPQTDKVWFELKPPVNGFYFDHHQYIDAAIANGARIILCQTLPQAVNRDVVYIVVPNVIQALTRLANWVVDAKNAKVIAVTGSSGKTTTVEALYTMLKHVEPNTGKVYTQRPNPVSMSLGVLNLYCGTLQENALLIVEMPTDHHGCITALARVIPPDVAVVLNVRDAHINVFGWIRAIAHAKSELVKSLKPAGTMVLNIDDENVDWMRSLAKDGQKVVCFGKSRKADVRGEVTFHGDTSIRCHLVTSRGISDFDFPLIGNSSLYIPLAAIAVGDALGYPLAKLVEGISLFAPMPGRMEWIFRSEGKLRIFNNAEKCNAVNLRHLLESIADANWVGQRIMILGNFNSTEHVEMSAKDWEKMCSLFDSVMLVHPGASEYLEPLLHATHVYRNIHVLTVASNERALEIVDRWIKEIPDTPKYICLAAMRSKQDITPVVEYLKENYAE